MTLHESRHVEAGSGTDFMSLHQDNARECTSNRTKQLLILPTSSGDVKFAIEIPSYLLFAGHSFVLSPTT
jgi:hypothetical protein